MKDIHERIENYLNEDEDNDEYIPDEDMTIMNSMLDFITDLDVDSLSEDQVNDIIDIVDYFSDNDISEELEEAFAPKRIKIKPAERRERRIAYRHNRAALKLKAKKFRRTAKFKRWLRKSKRKARMGKTATGKRIRKFL